MKTTKDRLIGIGICVVVIILGGAVNSPVIASIGIFGTVVIALLNIAYPVKKKKKTENDFKNSSGE